MEMIENKIQPDLRVTKVSNRISFDDLFERVFNERKNGKSVRIFLREIGKDQGNFYKRMSQNQKERLSSLKCFSTTQKEEFKILYLNGKVGVTELAKKYHVRTKVAVDFAHEITDEYLRSLKNHNRKLSKYQVTKMLVEHMRDGARQIDLSEKYGISASNVSNICAGRHWKHLFQGAKNRYKKEILSIAP